VKSIFLFVCSSLLHACARFLARLSPRTLAPENQIQKKIQMMAPALVSKIEGIAGTRKIVEMEKQDNERSHRRLAVREVCTELGLSVEKKMEAASKAEKKSHRQQVFELILDEMCIDTRSSSTHTCHVPTHTS